MKPQGALVFSSASALFLSGLAWACASNNEVFRNADTNGGTASGAGGGAVVGTGGTVISSAGSSAAVPLPPDGDPGCGLGKAAFCDAFDAPSPGGRAGDLDDSLWSVARISTPGVYGQWQPWRAAVASLTGDACGKPTAGLFPDNDIFLCAGGGTESMHLNDVEDDGGGFTIHSYRARKPFDFSNRTGVIAFDVGAKGQVPGGHGFWFNIAISQEPVPAPYQEGGAIALFSKGAILIEFQAGGGSTECVADGTVNGISSVSIQKDYKLIQEYKYLFDRDPNPCFTTVEEVMNHVEIHISEDSLEVLVSDAGDPSTLRVRTHLDAQTDPGFHIPFSRGYVNFQQTHYNGDKCPAYARATGMDPLMGCGTVGAATTYHWDNLGFDGPSFPTPRAYELPDALEMHPELKDDKGVVVVPELITLGYRLSDSGMMNSKGPIAPMTLPEVDLTNATDAYLSLNAWGFCPGEALGYRFNGGEWRSYECPFPLACEGCGDGNTPLGTCDRAARAVVIPVALADLQQGDNTIELSTNTQSLTDEVSFANAELTVEVSQ